MPDQYPAASLFKRLMAIFYDALLLLALLFTVGLIFAGVFTFAFNGGHAITPDQSIYPVYRAIILSVLLVTAFLYFGWFWTHGGQSLGMKTWRLKIVTNDGGPTGWGQALARFLVAILSWLCVGLGFIWILVNKDGKAWHDLASATRVVQLPKTK